MNRENRATRDLAFETHRPDSETLPATALEGDFFSAPATAP
jgi:hypothetical protein